MKTKLVVSVISLLVVALSSVNAQNYPTKVVTMIVPFAAGGPTDTVARLLGGPMTKTLKQQIIVENVGGAGGTIAANRVAKAKPDGYTILIHHIGMSTAPALYRKLAYNPLTDFEHIGLINEVPMTLVAKKDFPAKDLKELSGVELDDYHRPWIDDVKFTIELAKNPDSASWIGAKFVDVESVEVVDELTAKVTFTRVPKLDEVPYPVRMEPNLVVEFYSR